MKLDSTWIRVCLLAVLCLFAARADAQVTGGSFGGRRWGSGGRASRPWTPVRPSPRPAVIYRPRPSPAPRPIRLVVAPSRPSPSRVGVVMVPILLGHRGHDDHHHHDDDHDDDGIDARAVPASCDAGGGSGSVGGILTVAVLLGICVSIVRTRRRLGRSWGR